MNNPLDGLYEGISLILNDEKIYTINVYHYPSLHSREYGLFYSLFVSISFFGFLYGSSLRFLFWFLLSSQFWEYQLFLFFSISNLLDQTILSGRYGEARRWQLNIRWGHQYRIYDCTQDCEMTALYDEKSLAPICSRPMWTADLKCSCPGW